MNKLVAYVGMCGVFVAAVSGCGGGGNLNNTGTSPFAGTYVGTFQNSGSNNDTGEVAIQVTSSGGVNGRFIDLVSHTNVGISSGTITSTGVTSLQTDNGTAIGLLNLSAGQLNGTVNIGARALAITLQNLPKISSVNSFSGFYSGSFTYNTTAGSSASFIIDSNDNVTCWIDNTVTNNISTDTGTITSGGVLKLNTFGTVGNVQGTLAFNSSHLLTGTLTGSGGTPTIVPTLTPNF
jgi:hypothetical protein